MMVPRSGFWLAVATVCCLAADAGASGQVTLARARNLYVSAAYDEALAVLGSLKSDSSEEAAEIAGYEVLCLLALGRAGEAHQAIEVLVKAHPLYRPSEAVASPRTRAVFDEVRQRLLPGIAQESYDRAKAAFDRKESKLAVAEFDRVLLLLDDPFVSTLPGMADLRRLAVGFRDLSVAAAAPPAPPVPAGLDPVAPLPPFTYSAQDTTVVPPTAVSRSMPPWRPRNSMDARREHHGVVAVLVDEKGDVLSATVSKSVHPEYDAALLEKARTWKFRPATKDGVPVRYRIGVEVLLRPSGT
jgi:TonB family protein